MSHTGLRYWPVQWQLDWPADDACKARLGNRWRDSHIYRPATTTEFMIFRQGLLANIEMTQRSNPAL